MYYRKSSLKEYTYTAREFIKGIYTCTTGRVQQRNAHVLQEEFTKEYTCTTGRVQQRNMYYRKSSLKEYTYTV